MHCIKENVILALTKGMHDHNVRLTSGVARDLGARGAWLSEGIPPTFGEI